MARKAKYWVGVLYPDNMKENWQIEIGDILGVPYSYCIHDKDMLSEYNQKQGESRKVHVHCLIAFPNTTTQSNAFNVLSGLSADGCQALNTVQACNSVRNTYEYLIHNTETAIKQGKYLYSESERICGNNFDIGCFEQLSMNDKNKMAQELCEFISSRKIYNFVDFYDGAIQHFGNEYFEIIKSYSGLFERLCKGNYHKLVRDIAKDKGDV